VAGLDGDPTQLRELGDGRLAAEAGVADGQTLSILTLSSAGSSAYFQQAFALHSDQSSDEGALAMKTTLSMLAVVAAVFAFMSIGESGLQSATSQGAYAAKRVGGSCYNICRFDRKWSSSKCRRHCQGRA
jgi:hypothetical protein